MQKTEMQIDGTHCQACKARIESGVGRLKGVKKIRVDWQTGKTVVEFDGAAVSRHKIVATVKKLGYGVKDSTAPVAPTASRGHLSQRLLLGGALLLLIVAGYFLVQRSGALELLARLNERNLGYGLIFVIGLLSSFHCVGMCGGLVVTYTASCNADGRQKGSLLPHLQYNLGRLVSYTLVGAVLGGFGSFFGVSAAFSGALTVVIGVLMIVMGLSFVTEWKWLRGYELGPLSRVARFLYGQEGQSTSRGPLLIGLLNGFMPCGPLQAMQLYALASGSVVRGALSLGVYALGTVPLLFGFGSVVSLLSQERVKLALRVSGVVVVILGVLMLNRGLANFGLGVGSVTASRPGGTATTPTAVVETRETEVPAAATSQTVTMYVTLNGYEPNTLQVKKGIPVRWVIDVKQMTRCTDEIILPEYNIRKKLRPGENVVEFTPTREGVIRFSCWMQMVWGKFVVS